MSNVYHNHETIKQQNASGANSQIDQLRTALAHRLDEATKTGQVEQINLVKRAISQLDASQKPHPQTKELSQSQTQTAQARQAIQAVNPLTQQESNQIKAIRGIPSIAIHPGQKFASYSGREPSIANYMRTNIQGLFDLVETKKS